VVLGTLRDEFINSETPELPPKLPDPPVFTFDQNHDSFANFASIPISLDGKEWMTSEHLFQAWKVRHSSFLIGAISKLLFNSSRMTPPIK
jgi:hypothetical protein